MTELFAETAAQLSVSTALITMIAAMVLGTVIAITYKVTQNEAMYQRSLAITLFMLPVILSVIILFVGSNVARAFSMAGTLSIIRFRSAPGDAKDIGFIFFDVAAGLACGVGLYLYGAVFVLILCTALIFLEKAQLFKANTTQKLLKITIPETLNCVGAFDDIFFRYTDKYTLSKMKTTDLGSLFQLEYIISMKDDMNEQEFLNELRTRNGNLTIMLSEAAV